MAIVPTAADLCARYSFDGGNYSHDLWKADETADPTLGSNICCIFFTSNPGASCHAAADQNSHPDADQDSQPYADQNSHPYAVQNSHPYADQDPQPYADRNA